MPAAHDWADKLAHALDSAANSASTSLLVSDLVHKLLREGAQLDANLLVEADAVWGGMGVWNATATSAHKLPSVTLHTVYVTS